MIRVVIFTYSGDAAETIECARIARTSMQDSHISIVIDAADPLDDQTISTLIAEGAEVRQSFFQRNGNLNGPECVRGVLKELTHNAAPDDIVIKIDPDTAILDATFILGSFNALNNILYVSSGDDRILVYGCLYAMTGAAAIEACRIASHIDMPLDTPEDRTIAQIILDRFGADRLSLIRPWTYETPTRWTAFNWQSVLASPERYVREHDFSVIITGSPRHPGHPIKSRAECLRRLRESKFQTT